MGQQDAPRARTGIAGLDNILHGGLPAGHLYLLQGTPGVGKTTLALQFLLAGLQQGEAGLYITLSETKEEILQVAASHGWSLDGLSIYELSTAEQTLRLDQENTLYAPADIELKETVRVLLAEVERLNPQRVVFDSLSEIRLLAQTAMRYRRQILGLKQYFAGRNATVLLLDDRTVEAGDLQVESLAHGVISLEQVRMAYGADRRRLRIGKLRGAAFRSGYHDFILDRGGLSVFPRLIAAEHQGEFVADPVSSGIQEFDEMLGGGLARGTSALVMGPAGTGKSALCALFSCAAAARGQRAALFLFEERLGILRARARALGLQLDAHLDSGRISAQQIDPAELAPDEFAHRVRQEVEEHGARVVVIDSINGYYSAMPEASFLSLRMHELLSYLNERGVATLVTMTQSGITGAVTSPVDVSYLADTILLLRHFEAHGRVRKAISVVKKRTGSHEDTIRELIFRSGGITMGAPLTEFHNVLSGIPVYTGEVQQLHDRA